MSFQTSRVAGGAVFVAGIVGRDASGAVVAGLSEQTRLSLERVEGVLAEHGLDRGAICSLRISLVDVARWPEVRDVVSPWFGDAVPPATVVGVTGLVDPAMEIEVEVVAAR